MAMTPDVGAMVGRGKGASWWDDITNPALVNPFNPGPANLPGMQGGSETTYKLGSPPAQGPAQGGAEPPGAPNTSPSTLQPQQGLIRAVQDLKPPAAGWTDLPAPGGLVPSMGARSIGGDVPLKMLARLTRGVY